MVGMMMVMMVVVAAAVVAVIVIVVMVMVLVALSAVLSMTTIPKPSAACGRAYRTSMPTSPAPLASRSCS